MNDARYAPPADRPFGRDADSVLTTGELIKRILELEEQGERDEARITELEGEAASDRADMAGLRAQADIDEHLIAGFEAQAALDRTEIANLRTALSTARQIGAAVGIIMASYKVTERPGVHHAAHRQLAHQPQAARPRRGRAVDRRGASELTLTRHPSGGNGEDHGRSGSCSHCEACSVFHPGFGAGQQQR